MKRVLCAAAVLLGLFLAFGCSARAKIAEIEPDTDRIQIIGQLETPVLEPVSDEVSVSSETADTQSKAVPATVEAPTEEPTLTPTEEPTPEPTEAPTPEPTATPEPNRTKAEQLCETARSLLDLSYHSGGKSPESGFDPGGFVYYCLNEVGVDVRRKTSKGYSENEGWQRVDAIEDLEPGDLCFFMTPGYESVNCVTIYLGDGEMIYPSSGKGKVITNDIDSNYWKDAFVFARRVF